MFEFVETPFFTKVLTLYLSDDEYAKLQAHLAAYPETAVVPGSGLDAHALRQERARIHSSSCTKADEGGNRG
ncbi:MAG TPA: hypothetical protein VF004_05960 [Burkholderiales bacterium]